ncbi:TlpA family protein disulfide reductase [Flavobacterium chungangense]|uniref:Thiol-disulfide oxidoreductase ResA n=1 Tax=Flavobacterium chungangense TaxID=554283 RepID=A0A6V6Z190_9FLAO|nr:TlpA disulfide reductase family protein [Flavobacterium chungangense]CAD0005244.1 Thiol-disulfide oxidoreductase ResA [Flavobacterium chungangense]
MQIPHKIKTLLVLTLILSYVSGTAQKKNDFVVFSGVISNKIEDQIKIYDFQNQVVSEIKLSPEGKFTETLKLKEGFYTLQHEDFSAKLFLEPGSNLSTSFDAKDFKKSLKFSGQGGPVNSYIQKKTSKNWGVAEDLKIRYALSETDFKRMMNKAKASKDSLLLSQVNISENFKNKEKRNINYEYINEMIKYETDPAHYTQNTDFKVSTDFLPELKTFDYDNSEDFYFSNSYKNIVLAHYRKLGKELAERDKHDNYYLSYITAVSSAKNQDIKNILLYEHAKNAIAYISDVQEYYKVFINSSTDETNNKAISQIYQKLLPLSKGNASPKFVGYDNYGGGKVSLDDLKGKYIYIDVWATWCGPCKVEIPHLGKIEEEYKGKNIQFLSISIDKRADIEKWKKMISDKKMGGIQVIADNAWDSKFIQDYFIKGIPRFILIDPQGNIVSSNAPRPSEAKLRDLLNGLNI